MKCNYCERRCELNNNNYGVCRMYYQDGDVVKERFPNKWYTYGPLQIEALPFYHAYPGSRSMTAGTTGCNFDCKYCINAHVVKEDPAAIQPSMYDFTPGELVRMAEKLGCHNIVFNFNEPTVSLPTLMEVSQIAQKAQIPMGCLTNAYTTEEATEQLASVFSFINISLKGLADDFCRQYIGIPDIQPVLRNIKRLAATNHVEVSTPIIQGANDHEIEEIAAFIASIDREIPWHIFRLQPEYKMKEAVYPNVDAINAALQNSRKILPYIYFHNFIGSDWVNTLCPQCGAEVIERLSLGCSGDILDSFHCQDNRCQVCGYKIKICGERVYWNSKEVS